MEWQIQEQQQQQNEQSPNGVGGMYVKVMTDEQMELLRQQIAVYASICEQLVQMHKSFAAQQDLAGLSFSVTQFCKITTINFISWRNLYSHFVC